jgi:hypothetical protein
MQPCDLMKINHKFKKLESKAVMQSLEGDREHLLLLA